MKTYHWCILLALAMLSGIIVGQNLSISYLKIKNDGISLDQLLSVLVTLFIGWYIPSKLSKVLENKRIIKNQLVDEINIFIFLTKKIKERINKCFMDGAITQNDKTEINLIFEEADIFLDNLNKQVEILDNSACNSTINAYSSYWRFVTGGNLMNQSYTTIDQVFNSQIIIEHYKFEIVLKQLAQKIQTTD